MKILHVIGYFSSKYGGPPKACLDMAKAMVKQGHEVSIYTTNIDYDTELDVPLNQPVWKDGVEIRYFPIQHPRFWLTSIPLAIALKDVIPKYDIVEIHSIYLFHTTITGFLCRYFGVPYIICPHGALDPFIYKQHRFRKSIVEFLFDNHNIRNATAIHFMATEEQKLAQPYIFGANSFVVPLGLNTVDYEKLPRLGTFRSQYPELANKRIVLFFGRVNFKKGLDILVKSFAKVVKIHEDAYLVIAGPDNEGYAETVKQWLIQEDVSDRAIFTGILQGVNKLAVLHEAEFFVLPSYSENFGISVVEAMACQLPVIISNQVNIWQEISEAKAGRVCACDVDCFTEKILELLEDKPLAQEMGNNGKRLVDERFQWAKIAKLLEHEYRAILSQKK